ncbi:DUF4871 domain-containing protein [Paenibacillus sediminis]|uniref:DUF4871 domain-containing protein n=1 Tax=Paenibacillus sediminis TaxID=664909 RepID=A0ABS4H2D4_9BACL|nr:DUF4871 domain-containing protein [Paenibacillus sediminis]MBP1936537.1 hypothetical protein [Paenibacillus sediminis]
MKKYFLLMVILLFILLCSGCGKTDRQDTQASPTFKAGSFTLYGIDGKIGILAPSGFKANVGNKYMWHFWGSTEQLSRSPFRVEGIELSTNKKYPVLLSDAGTSNEKDVWEYNAKLGGPNNGADAHLPTSMKIKSAGLWRLDAYLGGELFGSIIVDAK